MQVTHKLLSSRLSPESRFSRLFEDDRFGQQGLYLHRLANGIDPRDVSIDEEIKSVSHEHTFEVDTDDLSTIQAVLLFLSEKVSRRLRKSGLKGKTLTVKIRLQGFKTYSRAFTFPERTNFVDNIYKKAKQLLDEFYLLNFAKVMERSMVLSSSEIGGENVPLLMRNSIKGMKIRLIGVRISNFTDEYIEESLFTNPANYKKEDIHKALDKIKDRFGERSIHWGTLTDDK